MQHFKVVYDGPSRPMIETPTGRLLSVNEFNAGRWESSQYEVSDCEMIVDALNLMLEGTPELLAEKQL